MARDSRSFTNVLQSEKGKNQGQFFVFLANDGTIRREGGYSLGGYLLRDYPVRNNDRVSKQANWKKDEARRIIEI